MLAPATDSSGNPAANMIARVMPTRPPMRTSFPFRLFMPKSAPAAPAVAKKPMITWMSTVNATNGLGSAGVYCEMPGLVLKNTSRIMAIGMIIK